MGLQKVVTPSQAAKKWENLKKKYRVNLFNVYAHGLLGDMLDVVLWVQLTPMDLILPRTGAGTEGGQVTAATWPFFEAMHDAMGARDSIRPLSLIATAVDTEAEEDTDESPRHPNNGASTSAMPSTSTAWGSSGEPPEPSTHSPLSNNPEGGGKGRKRRRKSSSSHILEFLKEDAAKREARNLQMDAREEAREARNQAQMDRLLGVFEKLVDSQTAKK
ncbi:uncharacterized protein LOC121638256 isoform X1 [Melanotaenia boesemani]|uniref:uncharacterized protein LOC121638256 isoform X1 n=1 Tax=Melanotaenia boesemani TaxID=1250792 RepID=UPI001C050D29|nr:uncharacterized protein LOC121638256 isoform X1 [Melanotaenia boesemani]